MTGSKPDVVAVRDDGMNSVTAQAADVSLLEISPDLSIQVPGRDAATVILKIFDASDPQYLIVKRHGIDNAVCQSEIQHFELQASDISAARAQTPGADPEIAPIIFYRSHNFGRPEIEILHKSARIEQIPVVHEEMRKLSASFRAFSVPADLVSANEITAGVVRHQNDAAKFVGFKQSAAASFEQQIIGRDANRFDFIGPRQPEFIFKKVSPSLRGGLIVTDGGVGGAPQKAGIKIVCDGQNLIIG